MKTRPSRTASPRRVSRSRGHGNLGVVTVHPHREAKTSPFAHTSHRHRLPTLSRTCSLQAVTVPPQIPLSPFTHTRHQQRPPEKWQTRCPCTATDTGPSGGAVRSLRNAFKARRSAVGTTRSPLREQLLLTIGKRFSPQSLTSESSDTRSVVTSRTKDRYLWCYRKTYLGRTTDARRSPP